jgi:hypothetical protein
MNWLVLQLEMTMAVLRKFYVDQTISDKSNDNWMNQHLLSAYDLEAVVTSNIFWNKFEVIK